MAGTKSLAGSLRGMKKAFKARLKHSSWQGDLDIDIRKQEQQMDLPAESNLGSLSSTV